MLSDCKLDMAVFAVSALADRFKHLIPAQLRTA
jgi:hypothetical protein